MADSTCRLDPPPSEPGWNGAALAAGAAVLAGLVFGRKGAAGIAAGVAAAASMKLLAEARREEGAAYLESLQPKNPAPTPVSKPGICDWVDHDAVVFGHQVPDSAAAAESLKEKSLPLLDDDGLPVDHVTVNPAYPEEIADEFPLGPIIWEPGRFVQSRSDGTGETVWFGWQDMLKEVVEHSAQLKSQDLEATTVDLKAETADLPEPEALAEIPTAQSMPQPENEVLKKPSIFSLAEASDIEESTPDDSFTAASFKAVSEAQRPLPSSFLLLPERDQDDDEQGPTNDKSLVHSPTSVLPVSNAPPPPSLTSPSKAPLSAAPLISSKGTVSSILPQPRSPAEVPQYQGAGKGTASSSAVDKHLLLSKVLTESSTPELGAHLKSERHLLSPLAPLQSRRARKSHWPLVLMFVLFILAGILFGVRYWNDGELYRLLKEGPWPGAAGEMHSTASGDSSATPEERAGSSDGLGLDGLVE